MQGPARVEGLGYRVQGFRGFRVEGLGFRVLGFGVGNRPARDMGGIQRIILE